MEAPSSVSTSRRSELAVCAPRLASKSASEVALRQWFVRFAELKREEFHKPFIDLWCEALSDLEPELIEFACRIYFRSMKFFPMPGDIREIAEKEKHNRLIEVHRQEELRRNAEYLQREAERTSESAKRGEARWQQARARGERYRDEIGASRRVGESL
jgi:biotin carboxylase